MMIICENFKRVYIIMIFYVLMQLYMQYIPLLAKVECGTVRSPQGLLAPVLPGSARAAWLFSRVFSVQSERSCSVAVEGAGGWIFVAQMRTAQPLWWRARTRALVDALALGSAHWRTLESTPPGLLGVRSG